MHDHTKLRVWVDACDLAVGVYRFTERFPRSERFGLTQQMRRVAVSIPSNISEGASRGSAADFKRFLHIAAGSSAELSTRLHLALRLDYIAESDVTRLAAAVSRVRRMLRRLIARLATDD